MRMRERVLLGRAAAEFLAEERNETDPILPRCHARIELGLDNVRYSEADAWAERLKAVLTREFPEYAGEFSAEAVDY